MKKTKKIGLLVLVCSLFAMMILSNSNIQLANSNVIKSINYNEGNEQNVLNYYTEKQYFANINTTTFDNSAIAAGTVVNSAYAPFTYSNFDYFSGETLTRIGIPVKSVAAVDENQTFTLYVVNKTDLQNNQKAAITATHVIKLPKDQLGNSTTVNKWVYVDLSSYNITLSENETLAFSSSTDTVVWGYSRASNVEGFQFKTKVTLTTPTNPGSTDRIFFDIYVKEEKKLEINKDLKNKLKDINFSILGDSISTYTGYSNNSTDTNSTIGSNSVFYKGTNGITSVNDTWWMQTINHTGMKLLVNNSYSGDTIAKSHSTRALQLHDDTGSNAGTNPDVIAVYFGINDIKNGATVATFKTNYTTMINNIRNKYQDAKIFVFTHVPYKYTNASVTNPSAEVLEEFNDVIRDIADATEECYLVDLYANSGITHNNYNYYMYDVGLHPNAYGMDMITKTFIEVLDTVEFENETELDNTIQDENKNEDTNEENIEEVENPFTSTSLIKIISLVLIVGSIIVLISTFKNTKINKYE